MSVYSDVHHILFPLYMFQFNFVAVKNMSKGSAAAKYLLAENQKNVTDYYAKEGVGTVYDPSGLLKEFGINHDEIINPEHFKSLCDAINPLNGEPLLSNFGDKHRAGIDFAISPPKSFSALWAVASPEIRDALERINKESVASALNHLNEHCEKRMGAQGVDRQSVKFAAVQFQHSTSRENDPHLHLHNPVLNLSKSADDGKWRTIEPRSLMQWQTSADSIYQADLITKLQSEFPGISVTQTENGHSFEINGVPEDLIKGWSKRREGMLNEAENAGISIDDAGGMDRKFYETRNKKELLSADPHAGWSDFAKHEHGFTSEKIDRILNAEAINKAILTDADIKFELTKAVDKLLQHESAFKENALHRAVAEQFYGCMNSAQINEVMTKIKAGEYKLEQEDKVVKLGEFDGMTYFSTQSMISTETRLSEISAEIGKDSKHFIDPEIIEKAIADKKILSLEQADLVRHICSSGSLKIGEGAAGSGKSTASEASANAFKAAGYKVQGLAASWDAAKILGKDAGIESRAIAGFLNDLQKDIIKLTAKDVLVVDESGLLGSKDAEKLVSAVEKSGAKIIFLGEEKQLNSVSAGPAMSIMIESAGTASINTIRRQKTEVQREIVANLRVGKSDLALKSLDEDGGLSFHKTANTTKRALINDWDDFTRNNPFKSTLILAIKNEDVNDLNKLARQVLRSRGQFNSADISLKIHAGKSAHTANFAAGDSIILKKNSNEFGVKNKDKAEITNIRHSAHGGYIITAKLESGREIKINSKDYVDEKSGGICINHAYAVTSFSSQGDTKDRAFVMASGMDRRYAYIAMSRHRDEANLYVDEGAIKAKLKDAGKSTDRNAVKIELATQINKRLDKFSTLDFGDNKIINRKASANLESKELVDRMKSAQAIELAMDAIRKATEAEARRVSSKQQELKLGV
jgi:conjugative relaxase-like TrwC/TraI family protein